MKLELSNKSIADHALFEFNFITALPFLLISKASVGLVSPIPKLPLVLSVILTVVSGSKEIFPAPPEPIVLNLKDEFPGQKPTPAPY